jgi:DNA-binding IclR family transcriptional regulator
MQNRYLINSIIRACNILKCLSKDKAHFKISELARELHFDRSTTYRIVLSLEKAGLVEKDKKTGEYSLGMATFEIGNTYIRRMDLVQISKPIMEDLALKVQETVHLAVLSNQEIVYVEKVDSPRTLGVISKIGQRGPLYSTALGKVLLAHQSKKEQSKIIREIRLKPFTVNTITSKKDLMKELKKVREQGYALDQRESEIDIECIGAAIKDCRGDTIAALSISGPQKKIKTAGDKDFINAVVEAADLISSKMGYRREVYSLQ